MGFFGWVKNIGSAIVDTVKNVTGKVRDKVKDVYHKFTGQETADKAKQLYEETKEKYERELKLYNDSRDSCIDEINTLVEDINSYKQKFMNISLKRYIDILKKIRDAAIESQELLEKANIKNINLSEMKAIEQVIKIDFQKNTFKNNMKAIFTLGFLTRGQARESLENAEKEAGRVKIEIEKMHAEIKRLNLMVESLKNISSYFEELINVVDKSNRHLEFSLGQVRTKLIILTKKLINGKYSVRDLPKLSQKNIMLSTTLVKTLIEMSKMQYINTENSTILTKDTNSVNDFVKNNKQVLEELKVSA